MIEGFGDFINSAWSFDSIRRVISDCEIAGILALVGGSGFRSIMDIQLYQFWKVLHFKSNGVEETGMRFKLLLTVPSEVLVCNCFD